MCLGGEHESVRHLEGFMESEGYRVKGVCRAGAVQDHVVAVGIVARMVDAHHDRDVVALGRRRDQRLLGTARLDMTIACSLSVKRPVDSKTISNPDLAQEMATGSRSARTRIRFTFSMRALPST